MTEIKIVNIEAKPWWKFWTLDNLQVTVEDGRGKQKTFTFYRKTSGFRNLTKEFIAEKYCTGDQFWSLRQRENYKKELENVKTWFNNYIKTFTPSDIQSAHMIVQL